MKPKSGSDAKKRLRELQALQKFSARRKRTHVGFPSRACGF
jgi:hypothetical protein